MSERRAIQSGRPVHPMQLARLIILCSLFLGGAAIGDTESRLRSFEAAGIRPAEFAGATVDPRVYIVQLRTPSAAAHHATAVSRALGKATLNPARPTTRFDKTNASVQSHVQLLNDEEAKVIAKAGANLQQLYSYRYSLNGFAARMTPAMAAKFENMPEVLHVWEDEVRTLSSSHSSSFLGLFEAEVGLRGAPGLDGDGIIIGVIDSGVAPDHPALQDKREANRPRVCLSAWGETSLLGQWLCRRFKKMEDVQLFAPPENWNGICETGPQFTEQNCNNKMIGARFFLEGAQASGPIDAGEIFSPRDVDGHGTHTATTAAGNRVRASIFGTFLSRVEGIAPKARIATYKACWLKPGATRASCNTSDLANAIDMAVADGVDIINYSVGNSELTVIAPDDIALTNAVKAGVLTVVAAGNEGPNFRTIGSPSGNPAVITVAASTRDGQHSLEAIRVEAPSSIAGTYATKEASFTRPLSEVDPVEGQLVLVDDDDDSLPDGGIGNSIDACQGLVNTGEVSGNIAFIQRGGCDFDRKVTLAMDAGAIAAIVFNISGDPIVMNGQSGSIDIPALMIGSADGNLLLDEINNGAVVDVVLDKGFFINVADTGNVMASFSSRGPGPVEDILKPDVTAPGVNILAGATPDAINTVSGEFYAFLSGTSMSTPQVSGVGALLKQAHPEWSPAALKSALLTSARQDITLPSGIDAVPFDFGSGHIVPNSANNPGLIYDITDDEYDAFGCGQESTGVSAARCAELETAGFSFDAVDLNQPSISYSRLTNTRIVKRRVTNVSDTTAAFTAEIVAPPGVTVAVTPNTLSVPPGQSAEFDVSLAFVSGPNDVYRFGSLTWVNDDHRVRSVIAIRPLSIDAPSEIVSFGGTGSVTFPVNFGYTGSYAPRIHGLRSVDRTVNVFVDDDPSKTFSFRNTNGVSLHLFSVPPNEAFLRFQLRDELTDGDDDLDMYLYYCPVSFSCLDASNFVIPENFFRIGVSGEATSAEQIDVTLPGGGVYAVFVHGFDTDNASGGTGAAYTLLAWQFGLNDDVGNMSATGPAFANPGTTGDVTVNWQGLSAATEYLGGISHTTPDNVFYLTLINIQN